MDENKHIVNKLLETYLIHTYIQERIPEVNEDYSLLEQHLSICDDCAQKAHHILSELQRLSDWSIFEDNQILLALRIYEVLKVLEKKSENSDTQKRLMRWMRDFKCLTGGTFKVIMNIGTMGKRKSTKIFIEGFGNLTAKNSMKFDYVEELATTRGMGDEILVNFTKLESKNTNKSIKVKLDKKKRTLLVEFFADQDTEIPMGILLPSKSTLNPLLKEPVYNEGQKKWQIFFEDIDEGEYYFLFEPGYLV